MTPLKPLTTEPSYLHVLLSTKNRLSKQLESLNPFVLRKAIENKLNKILKPFTKRTRADNSLR